MRIKFNSIIFALIIVVLYSGLQVASAGPSVYKVFVDDVLGFKRVIELNYTPFEYKNLTLVINVSDNLIWTNDADKESLTIVSEQNLWDNKSAYLRYAYDSFNYTFNQPGTYGVYIKERPRVHPQTIIVKSVETPIPTVIRTEIPTATPTLTPPIVETPMETRKPAFSLWYILIAVLAVAGIILYLYSGKRK